MPRNNPYKWADRETDRLLSELETRIRSAYEESFAEIDRTVKEYYDRFRVRDAEQRALLENGNITEQQYMDWRLAQMGRGERFESVRDTLAEMATKANERAVAYINDATPGIYSLNRNFAAYTIEQVHDDVHFDLFDERTVRRLLAEMPEVMPYYPPEKAVDRGIDLAYGKKQISRYITSGIVQGQSIPKMAEHLRDRLIDMDYFSSIRAARTAATGAQNAGRMDTYVAAEAMGIKLHKEWMATLDGRTRHTHQDLDGESIEIKDTFWNGCAFPGDPDGPPEEIYNCRCTMVADLLDYPTKPRMTYSEWKSGKYYAYSSDGAQVRNLLQDIDQSAIITTDNGFEAFPVGSKIAKNVLNVKKYKNYYDVALHGCPEGVCIGTDTVNCNSTLLANYIRSRADYHGQPIRLLSCSTGADTGDERNFAENLANALNTIVRAPNGILHISANGRITVGKFGSGKFAEFKPNERRRYGG